MGRHSRTKDSLSLWNVEEAGCSGRRWAVDYHRAWVQILALLFPSSVSLEKNTQLSRFSFSEETETVAFVNVRKDTAKAPRSVHLGTW